MAAVAPSAVAAGIASVAVVDTLSLAVEGAPSVVVVDTASAEGATPSEVAAATSAVVVDTSVEAATAAVGDITANPAFRTGRVR